MLLGPPLTSKRRPVPASAKRPLAHQRRTAEALRANWHELDTRHYPMPMEPEALAWLIAAG